MTQRCWNIIFSSVFSALIGGALFLVLAWLGHWEIALFEAVAWTWATFKELELR